MKKSLSLTLLLSLLSAFCFISVVYSAGTEEEDCSAPSSPSGVLICSNADMLKFYGKTDYYRDHTDRGGYRQDLISRRISAGKKHFEIVYGGSHGTSLDGGLQEYSGYTKFGDHYPTENVPWFAGWSGTPIQDFKLIKYPWLNAAVKAKYGIGNIHGFDDFKNTGSEELRNYLNDGTFQNAILTGLNYEYAGQPYRKFMYRSQNSQYADRIVYQRNAKPNNGDWVDFVHVLQPPTALSWGLGTVYIDSRIGITYLDIPIAPFILQNDFADLSAVFETLPSGAAAGKQVTVGVKVHSSFQKDVTPNFSWNITGSGGNPIHAIQYMGHATTESGKLDIPKNGERLLYAKFTMPESDVSVSFKINEDGKEPAEAILDNNVLNSQPFAVKLIRPVPLSYNVLSRKVKFPLADGNDIAAQLTLPRGNWTSNAVGSLDVENRTEDLYRSFRVDNNPRVNEPSETIVRKPVISATIHRKDFGDDPENHRWLNLTNPDNPQRRNGNVSYDGSVLRDWEDTVTECDADGCHTYTVSGTANAAFRSGTDTKIYDVYAYNGRKTLPERTLDNKIEKNSDTSRSKRMLWESEPYSYNVVRWMHHLDENGQPYGWTPVDGQYERDFTAQASADIEWESKRTMDQDYKQARTAAKNGTNKKSLYDKAVFATDQELQKFDYPVKSGYYLNPTGTYQFTVETVTYKPTAADTNDHKDLVDALIDSFRYETDVMYINSDREAVNIRNEPLAKRGGGFEKKTGVLSANHNKGVDGAELLTVLDRSDESSRYTKDVDEIYYSEERDGSTHPYWKAVLEGYGESKTADSYNDFDYREFVKRGQHMYKITEKTVVTIVINKDNRNVYTHANMPNGQYNFKAWLADVNLADMDHAYKRLPALSGITSLDDIKVTVQGSMYDDLNN